MRRVVRMSHFRAFGSKCGKRCLLRQQTGAFVISASLLRFREMAVFLPLKRTPRLLTGAAIWGSQSRSQLMIVRFSAAICGALIFGGISSAAIAQSGIASVYAYAGEKTASGERAHPGGLTAAHRTLPFGTRVRVTNKSNGHSVVVRINDRGPFIRGRVIDLTPAAAR